MISYIILVYTYINFVYLTAHTGLKCYKVKSTMAIITFRNRSYCNVH
jgi:beta-N-acetylglucosaminidase